MISTKRQSGFTLVELAIVLVIVGLLAGSFITTLSSRIDATRVAETNDEIDLIKQALFGFAYSQAPGNIRLPCPDCNNAACAGAGNTANDGQEDVTGGACDAATQPGNLPWVTLGVGRSDAWGTHYSYWASDTYANTAGFTLASSPAAGESQIDDTTAAGAITIVSNVAAVVFSHGKDTYAGISEDGAARVAMPATAAFNDQRENIDTDAAPMLFISRSISGEGATVNYDDVLSWISEYELKAKVVDAEVLP